MTSRLRHQFSCGLLCSLGLSCALATQGSPVGASTAPLQEDLEALAAKVDKAHHPAGAVEPVTRFRAALEVHLLAADQEQGGQVDLQVRYMVWQRPDSDRVRHLIRYQVDRAGRPIERGRDQNGFWHLLQGEARDLTEADRADRDACLRDTMLARQLVRFLDPAAVIRSLKNPTAVSTEEFKVGRQAGVDCEVVEGSLPEFPLLRLDGNDAPVRVKLFVDKADGRLHAVLVRPERAGAVVEAEAEQIRLGDYQLTSGMLVPKLLEHSFREGDRLRAQSRVLIKVLDLRPEFAMSDFDRPRK